MPTKLALILCAAVLVPSVASASISLQDLFNGACINGPGGASACNWTPEFNVSDVAVDFDAIDVSFEDRAGSLGVVPAISYVFSPALFVEDGDGIWFAFNYALTVPGGVTAVDLELTDVDFTGTGGFVQAIDSIFSGNQLVADLVAEIDPIFGTSDNPVSATLGGKYTSLWVEKEIRLQSEVDGSVALGDLHQGYAPEPATLALLSGGLVGVVALRRRRSRAAAHD